MAKPVDKFVVQQCVSDYRAHGPLFDNHLEGNIACVALMLGLTRVHFK